MDLNKLSETLRELSTTQQLVNEIKVLEEKLAFYDKFKHQIKDSFASLIKTLDKTDKNLFIELILTSLDIEQNKSYQGEKLAFINSGWINFNQQKTIELLASRAGAFKPRSVKMLALDRINKNGTLKFVM